MSNSSAESNNSIKVWDPLIRVFHWSLVTFFLISFITGDAFETIHFYSGYVIAGLISFRIIWGLIGTRYARFFTFIKSPKVTLDYLSQLKSLNIKTHYVGHNPVAAMMVVALIVSIALTAFTGMATIAFDGEGPLVGTWVLSLPEGLLKEFHELMGDFCMMLVMAHIAGVIFSSLLENINLPKSMLTGIKNYKHKVDFQDMK